MKLVKKMRGFSMPQMIASVAIASVLTAVGANYYWDIVEDASTVGDAQSIEVVRDTLALTMNALSTGVHHIDAGFISQANSRVSGLSSASGNVIIAKADNASAASAKESVWWYLMAFKNVDSTKLTGLAKRLDLEYDGVESGTAGQVMYDKTCDAVQNATTANNCWLAFNIFSTPNSTVALSGTEISALLINNTATGTKIGSADFKVTTDVTAFVLK